MKIGILALQGNVIEHKSALADAAKKIGIEKEIELVLIRREKDLCELSTIILPGGESTTISLLLEKFSMLEKIKKIPFIFGTCAGLILMSKEVEGLEKGQKTLELMDISICRNAYGSQTESFFGELTGEILNSQKVMFIRAPKIKTIGKGVKILAKTKIENEIAIIEQKVNGQYLLGATCHPEMTTSELSEYFLKKVLEKR